MSDKVTKFNPNHGPDGKFSSGPKHLDTENFEVIQPQPLFGPGGRATTKPGDVYALPKSGTGIPIINSLGINTETGARYTYAVDTLSTKLRRFNITQISFETLGGDTIAQCRFGWTKNDDGSSVSQAHMVFDPSKAEAMKHMWATDQEIMKTGKRPWGAISYAKDDNELLIGTVMHEYAHGTLSDYTLKQPRSNWIDPQDPMLGDKEWKQTCDTAATKDAWQPPSDYAKQNYAELFAECTVKKAITGTTGNANVDTYVEKVNAK
jgi:hypothetical protein